MKRILSFLSITLLAISFSVFAQQSGGGGDSDLQTACEISGGSWTGSAGGNWACCWDDWGCYGCVDGNCKIKCTTQRCRDANGQASIGSKNQIVKALAPAGQRAPVAPKPKVKVKAPAVPAVMKSE